MVTLRDMILEEAFCFRPLYKVTLSAIATIKRWYNIEEMPRQ